MKTSPFLALVLAVAAAGAGVYIATKAPDQAPAPAVSLSRVEAATPAQPTAPRPPARTPAPPEFNPAEADSLSICSFNIQFLGNSRDRDDVALASILQDYDIVVIQELVATPRGFVSLNDECWPTNTKGDKPYDHVMFRPGYSTEFDLGFDMVVIDLVDAVRERWNLPSPYPGDPYDHNEVRKFYSDHHPVVFKLRVPEGDDD